MVIPQLHAHLYHLQDAIEQKYTFLSISDIGLQFTNLTTVTYKADFFRRILPHNQIEATPQVA